jgi:hypothetical protein
MRIETFLCAVLALSGTCAVPAHGQAFSTNRDLAEGCRLGIEFLERRGASRPPAHLCLGYFMGLGDSIALDNGDTYRACLPKNWTPEQLVRVFVRWADANPNLLHEPRLVGAVSALTEAFPCKKP